VITVAGQDEPPLQRLSAHVNGHTFAIWARVPPVPRCAILLLHGRTWSSLPDFDLQAPGPNRSVLRSLAAKGFAAYALDQRGYGETPRDKTGWITPRQAAADASGVLDWVAARHPSLPRPALLGWSLGAATAHLAAATSPAKLSALILCGYAPDPGATIANAQEPAQPPRAPNVREAAASDFISPDMTGPAVVKAFVETAMRTDPVHADWKNEEQFLCYCCLASAIPMSKDRMPFDFSIVWGQRKSRSFCFRAPIIASFSKILTMPGSRPSRTFSTASAGAYRRRLKNSHRFHRFH
jgi:pimeloyl-ACP methyl ester carboxylesterase